jgi:hypothetical protein
LQAINFACIIAPNYKINIGIIFMSFIRHKQLKNNWYAYKVTSIWDKKLKRSRSVSKYLGPVDPRTKKIVPFVKKESGDEKLILDFGDSYFFYKFILESDIYSVLEKTFFDKYPESVPLMIYRLCTQSAMYNCREWMSGNVLNIFCKEMDLSSQRISDFFAKLGDEGMQRKFFTEYVKLIGGSKKSVIIDATSLPNHIHCDFSAWGKSDGKIEKQFRFLCVVDQSSKMPLFYRFLPGNITDIITLQKTIEELKEIGVENSFALIDAGYYSESNIHELFNQGIDFLTRLPAGRIIYKNILTEHAHDIEQLKNAYTMGKRGYFAKSLEIDLYGHKAYAYLILDPARKAKETKELLQEYCGNKLDRDQNADQLSFLSCGVMVLVSSKYIPVNEILSSYYLRQSIEQIFGFAKSDLNLLPIRTHNDKTIRGYLFFQFLLLIFYIKIREKYLQDYTVEQLSIILRKVKCKVYESRVIPLELDKKQREIFELANILVPKFLGI